MKTPQMYLDNNGKEMPVLEMGSTTIIDGTAASAQSAAIDGTMVRILSLDNVLWIERGLNPTALGVISATPSVPCAALDQIVLPIKHMYKVAILGGKAAISIVGE